MPAMKYTDIIAWHGGTYPEHNNLRSMNVAGSLAAAQPFFLDESRGVLSNPGIIRKQRLGPWEGGG
jgi:hypothetical protein